MKKFKITNYEITSEKISQELRFVMISDWHNVIFGERNKPVFEAIQKINPDAILMPEIWYLENRKHRFCRH